jgi:hypothetical protein
VSSPIVNIPRRLEAGFGFDGKLLFDGKKIKIDGSLVSEKKIRV